MNDQGAHAGEAGYVERILGDELSRGDTSAQTVLPILRHLISAEDNSVFSDEILARVRGMLSDLATQLLSAAAQSSAGAMRAAEAGGTKDALVRAFIDNPQLLSHLHAQALEWQLTERLQSRLALDPVVSALLQALIASSDKSLQETAMHFLAAQARWCQAQRRMKLPLHELPGELFHAVLMTLQVIAGEDRASSEEFALIGTDLRSRYDEGVSRLGLASRLIFMLGGGAQAALSVNSAGLALFLSALTLASSQDRDRIVFATHETQLARLALSLRAAGLKASAVEQEFLAIHPDVLLPEGFANIGVDRAAAMLNAGAAERGGL